VVESEAGQALDDLLRDIFACIQEVRKGIIHSEEMLLNMEFFKEQIILHCYL